MNQLYYGALFPRIVEDFLANNVISFNKKLTIPKTVSSLSEDIWHKG
jgi:hypothetical protein